MTISKVAGTFALALSGFALPLSGASVSFKRGSVRSIVTLPVNRDTNAASKLLAFMVAVDQLTEASVRSGTTILFTNDADVSESDIPSAEAGPGYLTYSADVRKIEDDLYVPGKFNLYGRIHNAGMKLSAFDSSPATALLKAEHNYKTMITLLGGSFYTPAGTRIKKYSDFDTRIVSAPTDPTSWTPNLFADTGILSLPIFPPSYIRLRAGNTTHFIQVPTLQWGSGGSTSDMLDPTDDNNLAIGDVTIKNVGALLSIANIARYFTMSQIQTIGMKLVDNANPDIPPDRVGKEAVKPITFRVTSSANHAISQNFNVNIPAYNNWNGLSNDEVDTLIKTDMGNYFKSVFSSDGSDLVEVLF